jgi:hypothetical protein
MPILAIAQACDIYIFFNLHIVSIVIIDDYPQPIIYVRLGLGNV